MQEIEYQLHAGQLKVDSIDTPFTDTNDYEGLAKDT